MTAKPPVPKVKDIPQIDSADFIPDAVREVLKRLPPEQQQKVILSIEQKIEQTMEEAYQGPLPHPEHLEAFNKLIPNGADRIMAVYERQVSHRHNLEQSALEKNHSLKARGQMFGFAIATMAFGFAAYAASSGQEGTAIVAIITAVGTLMSAFIFGKKQKQ